MFCKTTTTALATIALVAGSAGAAHAVPDGINDEPEAPLTDVAKLEASVRAQLAGRVFGWQLAVAQDGNLVKAVAGGTARSEKDTGGAKVNMTPTMRMDIASATKTFTAVSTLQLLEANGLSIGERVAKYLPGDWTRGKGFNVGAKPGEAVRFRHLLAHTSGIAQALKAGDPEGKSWEGVSTVVKRGATVDSLRTYHNYNYTMLRVLNAELWRFTAKKFPASKANHVTYGMEAMKQNIFDPAGMKSISCAPADPATAMRSYGLNATQQSKGFLHVGAAESCAGHRGLFLSAVDHVRFLAHLRHGEILDEDDLETMDELRLGWDNRSGNEDFPGQFWHGGDLEGSQQIHTCGATFDDGTEVSLMVNSPVAIRPAPASNTPCGIALTAWKAGS